MSILEPSLKSSVRWLCETHMKQIRNYNWDVPEDNCVCLNDILKALILLFIPQQISCSSYVYLVGFVVLVITGEVL